MFPTIPAMKSLSQLEAQNLKRATLRERRGALMGGTTLQLDWISSRRVLDEREGGKLTHIWAAAGLTPGGKRLECFVTEHDLALSTKMLY